MSDWIPLSADEWTAVALSLKVALWATLASLPVGIAAAMVLARGQFWGKSLLDGLVHLPLILPPVVTGYLLLLTFGRNGAVGGFLAEQFGVVFAFRWTGAALAGAIMGFPLMVRAIMCALSTSIEMLIFARGLQAVGGAAGMILSFARAMGEFGATITFVSNIPGETQTLPSAIYTFTQVPGGDAQTLRLTLVAVALSFAALLLSNWLSRRIARGIGQA